MLHTSLSSLPPEEAARSYSPQGLILELSDAEAALRRALERASHGAGVSLVAEIAAMGAMVGELVDEVERMGR